MNMEVLIITMETPGLFMIRLHSTCSSLLQVLTTWRLYFLAPKLPAKVSSACLLSLQHEPRPPLLMDY